MPTEERPQNLCLDKGYDNSTGRRGASAYRYLAHIRLIGEEKLDAWGQTGYPARRWVVERTLVYPRFHRGAVLSWCATIRSRSISWACCD